MTAQDYVYFFLGASVLSLLIAFFFARQVNGSGITAGVRVEVPSS